MWKGKKEAWLHNGMNRGEFIPDQESSTLRTQNHRASGTTRCVRIAQLRVLGSKPKVHEPANGMRVH
jgi:hypothetical protein